MRRARFGALALAIVSLTASALPVAARGPVTAGEIRWTPLGAADLHDRATVAGVGPVSPRPFRVAAYAIRTVTWAALPNNGQTLPRLATPPGADPAGIPYKVVNGKNYYSPGNIASDGVRFVDAYVRTGNPAYLDKARLRAQKLEQIGIPKDGALFLPYGFDYPAEQLTAPWVSGYSQGFALSLFVRLYRVTGEYRYAEIARSVFMAFRLLGRNRAHWMSYVVDSDLWLEEYPSARPTHVFNGFNFALFGIYDYERLTRDAAAAQLLQGALATMRRRASAYRVPGGISLYDLVHRTRHEHYHEIHIWQLADLAAISGDAYFSQLSATFYADHH
jgi:D-glucuronyl C5-epimerase C-terminus